MWSATAVTKEYRSAYPDADIRVEMVDDGEIEQSRLQHASGLGLWVVKAAVESVDGSLGLNDDGTAVTISVPTR